MSHLIITNEHDMEVQVEYVTEIARMNSNSTIDITFPSKGFATLFMENLMSNFSRENIRKDCGLHLILNIPPDEGELDG